MDVYCRPELIAEHKNIPVQWETEVSQSELIVHPKPRETNFLLNEASIYFDSFNLKLYFLFPPSQPTSRGQQF